MEPQVARQAVTRGRGYLLVPGRLADRECKGPGKEGE